MFRMPIALTAVLALAAAVVAADRPAVVAPPKHKPIDVVICLDVSNSMDGLIASAKLKLWDVVNDLARVKPAPDLRVALYSYGNDDYDPKVGWVRKELDLTTDLDALYQKLNGLTTHGGTEYVARVCRDAVDQLKWSADPDALKVIFVCGNEPASQDPEIKLQFTADLAKKHGVVINPIFCGPFNHPESADWKDFAKMSGGRFACIDQDHGAVAIATPQDKELTRLSSELNTTYVAYGKDRKEKAENQQLQDKAALSAGAAPARANAKGGALYRNSDWDLVDRLKDDPKFDVKKVPEADLSDELKKMKPEQREKHVKDMLAKREAIQKKIAELSAQRDEYIRNEQKKTPSKADKAFDEAVRGALREQAAAKGVEIPK